MKSRAEVAEYINSGITPWIDKDILAESLNKYKPETEVIN